MLWQDRPKWMRDLPYIVVILYNRRESACSVVRVSTSNVILSDLHNLWALIESGTTMTVRDFTGVFGDIEFGGMHSKGKDGYIWEATKE